MPVLFFSGAWHGSSEELRRVRAPMENVLQSLHGSYVKKVREFHRNMEEDGKDTSRMELMYDSGAFTAWVKREPEIDVRYLLKSYRSFYERFKGDYKNLWFINLDVIPGSPGRMPSQEEIAQALRRSDENYKILSGELGHHVLPVFHLSESEERLHQLAEMNENYICISPRQGIGESARRAWAKRVHLALDRIGYTGCTHGLAATGDALMFEVPWRSIDSSSWAQSAAFGWINLNTPKGLEVLKVSEQSGMRKKWGAHFDTITDYRRELVLAQLDRLDLTLADIREKMNARALFNVYSMQEASASAYRHAPTQTTLLEF